MKTGWMLLGLLMLSTVAQAGNERYQALPLTGAESGQSGARSFILDTQEGHVWIWSENELITAPDGSRRYGTGFVYQGKLRPGTRPGEFIETPGKSR